MGRRGAVEVPRGRVGVVPLHVHLACIYCRAGRLGEARIALDRALELDPKLQKWADLAPLRVSGEP